MKICTITEDVIGLQTELRWDETLCRYYLVSLHGRTMHREIQIEKWVAEILCPHCEEMK